MENNDPQNPEVEPYYSKYLNPVLKEGGFTDEQLTHVRSSIIQANIRHAQEHQATVADDNETEAERSMMLALRRLAENPIAVIRAFRESGSLQPILDFVISLSVVFALVFLAKGELLEKSQTATLFGGIVGYLLGHTRRD